jgi:hypothetical protein
MADETIADRLAEFRRARGEDPEAMRKAAELPDFDSPLPPQGPARLEPDEREMVKAFGWDKPAPKTD